MALIKSNKDLRVSAQRRSAAESSSKGILSAPAVAAFQFKADEEDEVQLKKVAQLEIDEEETLQAKPILQRVGTDEEEEPLQLKASLPNKTGLPDQLKSGVENLSGYSLDDVKVHYNSSRPAQLNAHAYAQGTDIHVAPGQEQHLPHEAWHVVQQKQGRVQPTMQMKENIAVNDDPGLENEADMMGAKALQLKSDVHSVRIADNKVKNQDVIQPKLIIESGPLAGWYSSDNLRTFLNKVAIPINQQGLTVARGPLELIHDPLDYTIPTEKEIINYMIDPTYVLKYKELAARATSTKLEYGADHGDYHFTGAVSVKKAQWSIDKDEALGLMEAEITKHMSALLTGSKAKGWTSWYIGKQHGSVIGNTVAGPETKFTLQVQVNKELGIISYHGYPDQRLVGEGVGKSKSSIA